MGMRSYANFANVVKEQFVKSIAPNEFKILENTLKEADIDWGWFAQETMYGTYMDCDENVINAYNALVEKFDKETKLSLEIGYIDSETDTDIEEGHFWCVGNVTETTEAGKKYASEISCEGYVIFG